MISSKSNAQIKYLASLKNKKYREINKEYLIEGVKLVSELLDSGDISLEFVLYSEEMLNGVSGGIELIKRLQKTNVKSEQTTKDIIEYISDTVTPQGVIALVKMPTPGIDSVTQSIINKESFLLLDEISDAGNMGTIIRICVSFGIKNIICKSGTVDAYNPKTVRSTMGAITKVNIYYLNTEEFLNIIEMLKQNGINVVATSLKAKSYLHECIPSKYTAYVIGNEASGVSKEVIDGCSSYVKIKMEEIQESLNAAIATGIALYDLYTRGDV